MTKELFINYLATFAFWGYGTYANWNNLTVIISLGLLLMFASLFIVSIFFPKLFLTES